MTSLKVSKTATRQPELITFLINFFPHQNLFTNRIYGGHLFFHFSNARLWYLKQYRTFVGPKSGPNRWRRTNERMDEQTDAHQNFEAPYTKALRAIRISTSFLKRFYNEN